MDLIKIDRLIRSRRRTVGLVINQDAQLIVRAPLWTSLSEIQRIVARKHGWIARKQKLSLVRLPLRSKQFVEGEEFLFMGETYPLRMVEQGPEKVALNQEFKLSKDVASQARHYIQKWYKIQADQYIKEKVSVHARRLELEFASIKINDAKSHWGSCGHKRTLNFTWRLIMAPPRVIDYVIVHELMHIKHRNHSAVFWKDIKALIPDYKKDERWLKNYSHLTRI